MSNKSYLVGTAVRTLFPSFVVADFDSEKDTIALGVNVVPVLWVAMFRPEDLSTQEIEVDGDVLKETSVIAETSKSLAQLEESLPFLEEVFEDCGSLVDHAHLLAETIRHRGFQFLTIDLSEIEALYGEEFNEMFALALKALRDKLTDVSFAGAERTGINPFTKEAIALPVSEATTTSELFGIISGVDGEEEFPDADCLLRDEPAPGEDERTLSRLLGCRLYAPVLWERY